MVTIETWWRRDPFRNDRWARLLIDTLRHYRETAYLLHEFVVMPDHLHILVTPLTSLEKAVQFIKGGFSYRAKKELGSNLEVWQKGFADHRIRDEDDYRVHVIYIRQNPVRKHLCELPEDYLYSSAHAGFELDGAPQALKLVEISNANGAPEGAPFQNLTRDSAAQSVPIESPASALTRLKENQTSSLQNANIARVPGTRSSARLETTSVPQLGTPRSPASVSSPQLEAASRRQRTH
jgi:putative transposase